MPGNKLVLIFLTTVLAAQGALAQSRIPGPNWNRAEAVRAAARIDVDAALAPLFDLARAGASNDLLWALQKLEQREDWSVPARERVLHAFAVGLGDLPPGSVDKRVLRHLEAYRPRTLIPHPDFPLAGMPLFNVPAAALGAEAAWRRTAAARRAEALTPQETTAWLEAWAAADAIERRGFIDGLGRAGPGALKVLGKAAIEQSAEVRGAATVAARAGILLNDVHLVQAALREALGPDLAGILRDASGTLDAADRTALLEAALRDAPAENGALAVALLAPGLLNQAEVRDMLFDTLGDARLGSAAALVLSGSGDETIRRRLSELAASGQDMAARRAALAAESWHHVSPGDAE